MAATHTTSRAVRDRLALACIAWLVAGTLSACAGRHAGATEPHGTHDPDEDRHTHAHDIDIEAAALPFEVLSARGGQQVATAAFFDELARADAVCVGESHPNPHHHWAQLHVLTQIGERAQGSGATLALGMEMFQRPFQGVLDDFVAGGITEAELLSRTGWQERWGYDFALYRPIVRLAVDSGMVLLALNVARELRKKLARVGVEGLSPDERGRLPEMDLDDAAHKAWFDGVMAEMGGAHAHTHAVHGSDEESEEADAEEMAERARRIYTAQVLWDETMADTAARWLAAGADRRVVILAGSGHCHDSAIVSRLRRRGVAQVISVTPVVDDGEGSVAAELAEPITDYLFVMSP